MEFLNIGLLTAFLPLAAIPLVLHLLTLHRLRTVELSTFRFLFDSYVQQRRRLKFLEALLAMLRTAFLLLLIVAIARPVVRHWDSLFSVAGSDSGRDVLLLVDASASMQTTTDGVTAIDRARAAAREIVDRLAAEDRVTIVRVAARPQEICNRFSSDVEAIRTAIDTLKLSPSRANMFAAFSSLFGENSEQWKQPQVYVLTDLQASGWGEFEDGELSTLIPDGTDLRLVNVGSTQDGGNRAVIGDPPESHRTVAGLPVTLRPRVTNFSKTETLQVPVSVVIDDKEIAQRILSVPPGMTETAELVFTPPEAGLLRGRFEIPQDGFPADDTFLFALAVRPQIEVLLVNGVPGGDPLENAAVYLRTGLRATEEDDPEPVAATTAANTTEAPPAAAALAGLPKPQAMVVVEIPQNQLSPERLQAADVVILANCGSLSKQQFEQLCRYVFDGGGLLILPGDQVNPDVYNSQFFPATGIPDTPLLPVKLAAAVGDPEQADSFHRFGAVDTAHPVLQVFADATRRYLTRVRVYRHFPLELNEQAGSGWPLIEFDGGGPALIEGRLGAGRVVLSAFPFHAQWSNLTVKPEFVPLLLRLVDAVKLRRGAEAPSVVPAEGIAELAVSPDWAPASGKVIDASDVEFPLEFRRSNDRFLAAYSNTLEKGFYTVDFRGGRAEEPLQETSGFAVNLAAGESDFTFVDTDRIAEALPNVELSVIDATAEAQQLHGGFGRQQEIWRPLILLVLIIIAVEFLLSTLASHKSAEEIEGDEAGSQAGRWVRSLMPDDARMDTVEPVRETTTQV